MQNTEMATSANMRGGSSKAEARARKFLTPFAQPDTTSQRWGQIPSRVLCFARLVFHQVETVAAHYWCA